jgi:hypothetical protein
MAGFFGKLFGKKDKTFTEQIREGMASVYDPNNTHDRVAVALLANLQPQLQVLGFEISKVPATDVYISKDCRGYLYGWALGILVQENIERTKDNLIDTIIAAFGLTYGDELGRSLSIQTFEDTKANDKEVLWASDWAIAEMAKVYETGGEHMANGFYRGAKRMLF